MSTFVYDGDCAFCTACARLIIRWIPTSARIVPWQFTDLGALGLDRAQCQEAVQWIPAATHNVEAGPNEVEAGPVYRWVARHRHQLPGGTAACAMPPRPQETDYAPWH